MLDSWTITDADEKWDFQIRVEQDLDTGYPKDHADAYDPDYFERENEPEAAAWAREALEAWKNDLWHWAILVVTPVLKDSGVTFDAAQQALGGVDYGWLPGSSAPEGIWTSDRAYLRTSHLNDLMDEAKHEAEQTLKKIKEAA